MAIPYRGTIDLFKNQATNFRLHIITNGPGPSSPVEGQLVYFTNAGPSVDFGDGEGMYAYDGSSWLRITNVNDLPENATETITGIMEIATQAETNTGTDDTRAITPLKLETRLSLLSLSLAVHEVNITGTSGTAIFTDIGAVADISMLQVIRNDGLPIIIGLGTPFISLGDLNIPWTSSTSITAKIVILTN